MNQAHENCRKTKSLNLFLKLILANNKLKEMGRFGKNIQIGTDSVFQNIYLTVQQLTM